MQRGDPGEGLSGGAGLADNLDVVLGFQQLRDPRRTISWSSSRNTVMGNEPSSGPRSVDGNPPRNAAERT
jgi:hypothetical protein